jgi:hypothetical protein
MARKHKTTILTANHLLGGHSVFLSREGEWTGDCGRARVARTPEEAASLEAAGRASEDANEVVGVYLVDVEVDMAGRPFPTHYRERMRIRARPSFWPDVADDSEDRFNRAA